MTGVNMYLLQVLQRYKEKDLSPHHAALVQLHNILQSWASSCFVEIIASGSRAKGTAIARASDVDYLISLSSGCNENNGGLEAIYNGLHSELVRFYPRLVRPQNVSFRVSLNGLEVDVTPARKHPGYTDYHSLYISKEQTWKQTNVKKHNADISQSGRTNEIKILKIWRELNRLEFPSIYLEYLIVNNVLLNKPKDLNSLGDNVWHILTELAKTQNNPLFAAIIDPANSANILSNLLTISEKNKIMTQAQVAIRQQNWNQIIV